MYEPGFGLKDKVALVTGGAAGIGRAIVDAYLSLGTRVAVAEIDADKVSMLERELGDTVLVVQSDVCRTDQVAGLMQAIETRPEVTGKGTVG